MCTYEPLNSKCSSPHHILLSPLLYLQELQKRNEALLQMYGEKAEETEELRLDIQDLKEMYRQQIDALTKR